MNIIALTLAFLAGAALGLLYFGGLWWTVQKVVLSKYPMLWFFGSLVLRMSIALAVFYFIGRGRWEKLLLCLLGFIVARFAVVRFTRAADKQAKLIQEANHAP